MHSARLERLFRKTDGGRRKRGKNIESALIVLFIGLSGTDWGDETSPKEVGP